MFIHFCYPLLFFLFIINTLHEMNSTSYRFGLFFFQVAWIKSDSKAILAIHTVMVALNPRLSVTHNGHNTWKLHISHVELNDSGSYMCQGMLFWKTVVSFCSTYLLLCIWLIFPPSYK